MKVGEEEAGLLLVGEQFAGVRGAQGAPGPDGELIKVGAGRDAVTDGVGYGDALPFQREQDDLLTALESAFFEALFPALLAHLFRKGVSPEVLDVRQGVPPVPWNCPNKPAAG